MYQVEKYIKSIELFRPVKCGGLGLISVKQKSVSFLIKTFLELAANTNYLSSQFLSRLYSFHILGNDIPCPPSPPYYNESFYKIIREANDAGKDIINMSVKQWYKFITDQEIFHTNNEDGSQITISSRAERMRTDVEWEAVWKRVRHPALSSDATSFLWKLINELLTTEERLASILQKPSAACIHGCQDSPTSDQLHCFFQCSMTKNVGQWLLRIVERFGPTNEGDILKLNFIENDALTWIVGKTLHFIWKKRTSYVRADLPSCLALLHAEAMVLKETRHHTTANEIIEILNPHLFQQQ